MTIIDKSCCNWSTVGRFIDGDYHQMATRQLWCDYFFIKMGPSRPLFLLFSSFLYSWQYTTYIRFATDWIWTVEATAVPTEPQPLPYVVIVIGTWRETHKAKASFTLGAAIVAEGLVALQIFGKFSNFQLFAMQHCLSQQIHRVVWTSLKTFVGSYWKLNSCWCVDPCFYLIAAIGN